jgi:hypothetical protein
MTRRQDVTQEIKVNVIGNGTNQNHGPPDRMQLKEQSVTPVICMTCYNHEEMRNALQNIWPIIFKIVKITNTDRLRNCSRLKET